MMRAGQPAFLFGVIMDDQEELRQKLAEQIKEAFADTPYPGDENIGHGCGSEGWELEQLLRGKHWRELSLEFTFEYRGQLPCTTAAGFRFYLPAFMLASIHHYDEVDTLPDNLIFLLSPGAEFSKGGLREADIDIFMVAEKRAIVAFLKSYVILHPRAYPDDELVYRPLLDAAIRIWEAELGNANDA